MSEKKDYCLGRSYSASSRLNLQHYLWKDVVGYNIHPDIPVRDDQDFSIADVGTGTGIWLIDLSRHLTAARLDGFDISADQYPPKEWLPKNMLLGALDVHEPLPEQLSGKYDIVHVRLFLTVVKDDEPRPILEKLTTMLKPGGYLQWSDHNQATRTVESPRPGLKTDMLQAFVNSSRKTLPYHWVARLPETFRSQGLENVSHDTYPTSPELRLMFTQMQLMLSEEYSYVVMDNSDPGKGGPAHRGRVQEAANEAKDGAAMHYILEVNIGQKATQAELAN